jgi:hypothetical protein
VAEGTKLLEISSSGDGRRRSAPGPALRRVSEGGEAHSRAGPPGGLRRARPAPPRRRARRAAPPRARRGPGRGDRALASPPRRGPADAAPSARSSRRARSRQGASRAPHPLLAPFPDPAAARSLGDQRDQRAQSPQAVRSARCRSPLLQRCSRFAWAACSAGPRAARRRCAGGDRFPRSDPEKRGQRVSRAVIASSAAFAHRSRLISRSPSAGGQTLPPINWTRRRASSTAQLVREPCPLPRSRRPASRGEPPSSQLGLLRARSLS